MRRTALTLFFISAFLLVIPRFLNVFAATIADILVDDMRLPNEGRPRGVAGYSWENDSDGGNSLTFPSGYGALQGWGHLYEDAAGNPAGNSRVQVRNFQTWWLSKNGNWIRGQYENNFGGAAFEESYNSSRNGEIRMIDGLPTVTAGGGYNFHFWHTQDGWNHPGAGDYKAVATAFEARLVLGNPGGPDDRAQAKYLLSSAVDLYVAQDNHGTDGRIPNFGIGRMKYVRSGWRLFTHNTVSNADASIIRNNPPPLVVGTDNIDVSPGGVTPGATITNPPPTNTTSPTCPKKTQGDANCDNNITVADYNRWRQEYLGQLTTKTADFNGSTTVTVADYNIWRKNYLSQLPGITASPAATVSPGVTVSPGPGACVGARGVPIKIMPLGDSTTAGDDRGGYRFRLYTLLRQGGFTIDFVGPHSSGSVPDNNHAGYGGYQIGRVNDTAHGEHMISKEIPSIVPQFAPSAILLMGGVNDKWGGWNNTPWTNAEVSQNVIEAVRQINTLRPETHVFVAALSRWGPGEDSNRTAINAALKTGINQLVAQGKPVTYVEAMGTDLTSAHTPTDVHPNASGYDKMADIWYQYLNTKLCK